MYIDPRGTPQSRDGRPVVIIIFTQVVHLPILFKIKQKAGTVGLAEWIIVDSCLFIHSCYENNTSEKSVHTVYIYRNQQWCLHVWFCQNPRGLWGCSNWALQMLGSSGKDPGWKSIFDRPKIDRGRHTSFYHTSSLWFRLRGSLQMQLKENCRLSKHVELPEGVVSNARVWGDDKLHSYQITLLWISSEC